MKDDSYIPLLSGRSFDTFTPEEFKLHVRGLYHKKEAKKATPKEKKPFTFRINKKGNLCLRVNRAPKWISEEEVAMIKKESGVEMQILLTKLSKAKIEVRNPNQLELPF